MSTNEIILTPEQIKLIVDQVIARLKEGTVPDPEKEIPTVSPADYIAKVKSLKIDLGKLKIVNMRDNPKLFKVVDKNGKNVATDFKTSEKAQLFVKYVQMHKDFPQPAPVVVPPPPPPIVTPEGDLGNTFGVKPIYGNGLVVKTYKENFRDDGKRFDFTVDYGGSSEATGYFALTSPIEDEVSGKFSENDHSPKSKSNCYDLGIRTDNGKTRIRFEEIHPDYTKALATGQNGVPLGTKFVGYKFIKKVNADGTVLMETWQDGSGNNEGNTPSNSWTRLFSWVDTNYKVKNSKYVTIRIDDPEEEGLKQLKAKWVFVQQIK